MAFMLFCRKFENVVSHAFLELFFWVNNLVYVNFYAFCNYGPDQTSVASDFQRSVTKLLLTKIILSKSINLTSSSIFPDNLKEGREEPG